MIRDNGNGGIEFIRTRASRGNRTENNNFKNPLKLLSSLVKGIGNLRQTKIKKEKEKEFIVKKIIKNNNDPFSDSFNDSLNVMLLKKFSQEREITVEDKQRLTNLLKSNTEVLNSLNTSLGGNEQTKYALTLKVAEVFELNDWKNEIDNKRKYDIFTFLSLRQYNI